MNWLDYLLIAILGLSALQSFRRGFTREIISLIAAIAALVLGMWFYGTAGALVRNWVSSDRAANLIGFLLVVFAVLAIGAIVGSIVRSFLEGGRAIFFRPAAGRMFWFPPGLVHRYCPAHRHT